MVYYPVLGAREFTDYRPQADINNSLMNQYNIKNNNDYRKFIQDNGNSILKALREQVTDEECKECPVCKKSV